MRLETWAGTLSYSALCRIGFYLIDNEEPIPSHRVVHPYFRVIFMAGGLFEREKGEKLGSGE